jgi:NADH-quinone oxidoreductase subunit N
MISTTFLIAPQLIILIMACIILIVGLFVRQHLVIYGLTQLTLVGAFVVTLINAPIPTTLLFNSMLIHDLLGTLLNAAIFITSFFVLAYSRDFFIEHDMKGSETYLLALFSILGMSVLVTGYNFITLYLGLELMSLPIYALVAFRRDLEISTEAGMKYFVLGALASGILLYGLSLIYGATASLQIDTIGNAIGSATQTHPMILVFGIVFVVAGLAFKLGVVPFHMWLPDVYTGAPNSSTLFIAVAPKIAAFALVIRLLVEASHGLVAQWQQLIILMAILSMLVGNITAIMQTNFKRLLAYSTIAQGGYILLGFAAASSAGYSAALFYTLIYAITSLGAFGLLVILSRKGLSIENVDDLKGLSQRNPWLAFLMLLFIFSMAGIPPTAGFFVKLTILQALINAQLTWLAAVAIVFAAVAVYYYLRIIKVMYFESPSYTEAFAPKMDTKILMTLNGLAILYFGIFPSGLLIMCRSVFGLS